VRGKPEQKEEAKHALLVVVYTRDLGEHLLIKTEARDDQNCPGSLGRREGLEYLRQTA
jgi:hypothetical protein